ncbi:hypothetical protein PTTG_27652 [Puccinia triticina 1-1 BBBD Race 1]|uniref:Uncharacterized protein n=1 Tax=Puccinia triticina (isolate 1-1 / race 1 (BBBD)) TaxID=630390 RepID=A0A180GJ21_PUCT1|nr:hypothetical protein PTTG_27652 [Puccinia triticina 1-1 BBBD Race 1]
MAALVSNINPNGMIATVTSVDVVTSIPLAPTPKPSLNSAAPLPTGAPQLQLSGSTDAYSLSKLQQTDLAVGQNSSTISFAKLASTPLHSLLPTSTPAINSLGVEQAPTTHTSSRAVATTLIALLFVFGIIFCAGYWASDRSSRWKSLRWTRDPGSEWAAIRSGRTGPKRYQSMRQVFNGRAEQTASFNLGVDQSGASPGLNSNKVKRNPLQSYLNYRRGCATDSLKEIDEEKESTNESTSGKKTVKPSITADLGPSRYRLKAGRWGMGASKDSWMNSSTNMGPNSRLSSHKQTHCISHMDSPGRKGSRAHLITDLDDIGADATFNEFGINRRRREGGSNQSTGASYLLTRLKESITKRSKLSSARSTWSHFQPEPPHTKGKEPVEWEFEDEVESNPGPDDASELRYLVLTSFTKNTPSKGTRKRELSLAEIPLPEMPAVAWDMTAAGPPIDPDLGYKTQTDTCRRCCEEMTTPTRPRYSDWILSSKALSPSSLSTVSPETPTRKPEKPTPNLTESRTYPAPSRLNFS